MRTVQKVVVINHLAFIIIFSCDWCCAIGTSNVDTNKLVDVTSQQLSSYPQRRSFFPNANDDDKEYNTNKHNSYESQVPEERQVFSSLYSKYAPILEYNTNPQSSYMMSNKQRYESQQEPKYMRSPNEEVFRFSNDQRPQDDNNGYNDNTYNRYESQRQEDRQQYYNIIQPQYAGSPTHENFRFSNDQREDSGDNDYNSNKYSLYQPQEQDERPQYSPSYAPQYSQNEVILDYNPNLQPQFAGGLNYGNYQFNNDPGQLTQENYFNNQNEVIPQQQEQYYANQNKVIPLPQRRPTYYRPQAQAQVNNNYYEKYRRIPPPANNNYNNQNNGNYADQYDNYDSGPPNRPPNRAPNGYYPNRFNGRPFGGGNGGNRPQNPNQYNGGNNGNKLTKVIEDISKNDDYQCVPKLICQTLGDPANVPSFLNGPTLATVMAIMPQDSPYYNFGKAALLGINSGMHSCHGAFPKCPRNEEDILYYLNNHRGGFFRLFNRGLAFGDDSGSIYHNPEYANQENPIYQNQQNPNIRPGDQTNLASLAIVQNLVNSFTKNGLNLNSIGNLASLVGTQNKNGGGGSSAGGIGGYVNKFISGAIGKLTGRSKRSIDKEKYEASRRGLKKMKQGISRKRNLDLELINPNESFVSKKIKSPDSESRVIQKLLNSNENSLEIAANLAPEAERRILNLNDPQIPIVFDSSNKIEANNHFFPKQQQYIFQFVETNRVPKKFFPLTTHSENAVSYQNILRFPTGNSVADDHRGLNFVEENQLHGVPRPLDYYDTTKMIFPDRTGTGNLRFDNDAFHSTRFGKIVNRQPPVSSPTYTNQNNYQYYDQFAYPSQSTSTSSLSSSSSSSSRPNYYSYSSVTRDPAPTKNTDNNVYVTNGQGVVEYYINERGQKIYT